MPTNKVAARNFTITYSNGKEIKIRRLFPNQLAELSTLLQAVFERFYEVWTYSRNCLGDVLGDVTTWGYIEQIATILKVEGQKEPGIDLSLLADDYEQLCRIFITQSVDPETGAIEPPETGKPILPSLIADLHGQNFFRVEAVDNYNKREQEKQTNSLQAEIP